MAIVDMQLPKPEELLRSTVLVIAPHMDDEVIGCGGLMLRHEDKRRLYCTFVTDGARSPVPLLPWTGNVPEDLAAIRVHEANDVLSFIGMPHTNIEMLNLPDGQIAGMSRLLREKLKARIGDLSPDYVFVPFRYDLHSDHVAVHRAVRGLQREGNCRAKVFEYIVYYRWRLINGGDVRRVLRPDLLFRLDIASVASKKKEAISRYHSQSQVNYDWQEYPILTPESISARCREPELYLYSDPAQSLSACFAEARMRAVMSHYVERYGKRKKDQAISTAKWLLRSLSGSR
jgi:LmbE family N-acetylglucosaminyl deacetylase